MGNSSTFEFGSSSRPREPSPSGDPILITSIPLHPPSHNSSLEDRHGMVVEQVIDTLNCTPCSNQSMDDSSSEDSGSLKEVDDDMTLGKFSNRC